MESVSRKNATLISLLFERRLPYLFLKKHYIGGDIQAPKTALFATKLVPTDKIIIIFEQCFQLVLTKQLACLAWK